MMKNHTLKLNVDIWILTMIAQQDYRVIGFGAADDHIGRLQVVHCEASLRQAPNRQEVHGGHGVDENLMKVRNSDVPLNVELAIVVAMIDDIIFLLKGDLIHKQGVHEELMLGHGHFIEFWL